MKPLLLIILSLAHSCFKQNNIEIECAGFLFVGLIVFACPKFYVAIEIRVSHVSYYFVLRHLTFDAKHFM
jgi:hypothetical protein